MVDIVKIIGRMKGWEDIPRRFEQIYFGNVHFKICRWEAVDSEAPPYLGMVGNEHFLERPEAGGGNFSRRAKRHVLTKFHNGEELMDATLEVLALKHHLVWEGADGTAPRFKFGTQYPLRFSQRDKATGKRTFYSVRRTTKAEHYQNENVLYAGLNEDPNVVVMFRKMTKRVSNGRDIYEVDDDAGVRADKIGTHDFVRLDFYDANTKEHIGWLQNNGGICTLQKYTDLRPEERTFKFMYV
ncbi:hypothetical protein BDV26DRAFT_285490 [Aspergillus bertholletiae]|uniref:Uncharacterized protein n=1 Tax=Aspergillus bertholletiae TaxID=1226010 RepID=A0A5N7AUK6_9EURO|nr:hypothetical protein BDV26DRAFT_285490 [Aspergillus bertholletiae]